MGLTIWVGRTHFEVGSASFLYAFFSTIAVRLENDSWASEFPIVMQELYSGKILHSSAEAARAELSAIRSALAAFPPDTVVWDFDDRDARPPWGSDISPHITSLANYFVTSDGKDLIDVLLEALAQANKRRRQLEIT